MSRWFRLYDDLVDDPKIQRLPGDTVKALLNLWCLASQNDGMLPPADDIAFKLRMKPAKVEHLLSVLGECGLIDSDETGLRPHNWAGRQYQSDTSKERVQRHRDKRAAAGLIPQWSAPAALRKAVYSADNFECVYCGATEFLSIDHRTSELNGGTHDLENLVTACRSCNGAKRDMSFDEYVTKTKIETLHGRYLKRPQSTDNRTEQIPDQKDSDADASGAEAPIDHRKRLFGEGLQKLAAMTGKGPDACRSFVGKCLKAASDDAIVVLGLIEDAERNQTVDPTAWIAARLKPRDNSNGKRTVHDAARDLSARVRALDQPAPELCDEQGRGPFRLLSQG